MPDRIAVRVPVGEGSHRWATRSACQPVLLVVHNVTSATRLLDVLPLLGSDPRLQLLATCTGSSPFLDGVPDLLASAGLPVLPWEQAKRTPVPLAVSASYGGELDQLDAELVVLSHGVGYNKKLAPPGTEVAGVFGMAPEWLLRDGRPVASATVLSHPEQLDRLRSACPPAVPTATLAGDPSFDRILAALPRRDRFRRALGVGPGQRLVLLNSTWSARSFFGDGGASSGAPGDDPGADLLADVLPRLTAELPADEYRVAAVLHPNIWYGHGPGQVQSWLDRARRAGLTVVPPLDGWRQALIAADCVVGDFGSVTYYGAAIGTPVLLGAFSSGDLDDASPVAALGAAAPRLRPHRPLRPQLDATMAGHDPASYAPLAEQTTSAPGESGRLLRTVFYRLIGIPEPDDAPALLEPLPLPPYTPPERTAPIRVFTRIGGEERADVTVTRYVDPAYEPSCAAVLAADGGHTVVHEETGDPTRLGLADVVVRYDAADDPRVGPPAVWTAEMLRHHPACDAAVYVTGPDRCVVRTRRPTDTLRRLTAVQGPDGRADLADPAAHASALYAWLTAGRTPGDRLTVRTGDAVHAVAVERLDG